MFNWCVTGCRPGLDDADLLQGDDLAAGDAGERGGRGLQSSDEQIQTVLVLSQQRGRGLVVFPQDELHQLGLGPQQGGRVRAALQEPIQDGKEGRQDRLKEERTVS